MGFWDHCEDYVATIYHYYAIRAQGGQSRKCHLDHIHDAPSVQSSVPEIETNGQLQEDVFLPPPSSRSEAEFQVTANQPLHGWNITVTKW